MKRPVAATTVAALMAAAGLLALPGQASAADGCDLTTKAGYVLGPTDSDVSVGARTDCASWTITFKTYNGDTIEATSQTGTFNTAKLATSTPLTTYRP